jgi:hypothetical protein
MRLEVDCVFLGPIGHIRTNAHHWASFFVCSFSQGPDRGGSRIRGFVDLLVPMCGLVGVESTLARVGPTTPKSIDLRLLRSI